MNFFFYKNVFNIRERSHRTKVYHSNAKFNINIISILYTYILEISIVASAHYL